MTIAEVLAASQDESPRFRKFLAWVLPWEATVSHAGDILPENDHDGAGTTFAGLTQRDDGLDLKTLSSHWLVSKYVSNYWKPSRAEEIPEPVCYVIANFAVNCGVGRASKWIQRALGLPDDGIIGPDTIAHCYKVDTKELARDVLDYGRRYYHSLGEDNPNLKGWLNRTNDLEAKLCG
jgi:lysozyme family protein